MRWRLILEEYNLELIYIQGSKNIASDMLSRLEIVDTSNPIKPNMSSFAEHFSLDKEDVPHPVNYKTSMRYQQTINLLLKLLNQTKII